MFKITKKKDDTSLGVRVLRASLGGNAEVGYYLTYRGTLPEIKELLEKALAAIKFIKEEPNISDDEGKQFA